MIIWREHKKTTRPQREALIDTNQCEEPTVYSSAAVLVRVLRNKLSSELAAANEYAHMIESLNERVRLVNGNAYQNMVSIINWLSEVRNDEEHHAGVLLQCIQLIDPEVMKNGINGFKGTESRGGRGQLSLTGKPR